MKTIIYIAIAILVVALFVGAAMFVINKNNQQNGTPAATTTTTSSLNAVQMVNMSFSPATLTVKAGTTVTFQNMDSISHTATADDGTFDTGILSSGQSQTITFTKEGSFVYHCSIHPQMVGTIVVTK